MIQYHENFFILQSDPPIQFQEMVTSSPIRIPSIPLFLISTLITFLYQKKTSTTHKFFSSPKTPNARRISHYIISVYLHFLLSPLWRTPSFSHHSIFSLFSSFYRRKITRTLFPSVWYTIGIIFHRRKHSLFS